MFRTLTRALNMFSMKNRYYNTSDNRLLATHLSKYSVSRIELLCCNAAKNQCECVRTCKRFEPIEPIEPTEKNFKCEITNKPPRLGDVDCNCEIMCMVKKSETMTITESKKNN